MQILKLRDKSKLIEINPTNGECRVLVTYPIKEHHVSYFSNELVVRNEKTNTHYVKWEVIADSKSAIRKANDKVKKLMIKSREIKISDLKNDLSYLKD